MAGDDPRRRAAARRPRCVALDAVRSSVDFAEVKEEAADFQAAYVAKTVEIPLYYRENVDLRSPRVGNFVGNPTQAGPTWNAVDWFVRE